MPTVVGVRLRFSKTLWFDPDGAELCEGDIVIVRTERKEEYGTVVAAPFEAEQSALPAPVKRIERPANDEDLALLQELRAKEAAALPVFRERIESHRLDMKPVDVQFVPGGDKAVFFFSADERVDFRDLVRELATHFQARVEMRQVGVRDEARAVGGVGHCGQQLCCARFGGEFQPVSIRMAKEQDLPLNPLKISGLCGRLMCCLRYEYDAYKDFKSRAPKRGAIIDTPSGLAKVAELNTPREAVRMRFEDGSSVTVPLSGMECGKGGTCPCSVSAGVLEEVTGVSALPLIAEQPAQPRKQRPARGDRSEKPAEVSKEQHAPREGAGRRKRRRRSGSAEESGAADGQAQQGKRETSKAAPKRELKSEPGQAPSGEQTSADKPSRSSRRRRRRRPGGSGGGDGTTPAS
jgi:cell fate regulator YaaT (PSP1 superfamily)